MEYINLKYKSGPARRRMMMRMGGFQLVAHVKYDNGKSTVRAGQLSLDFALEIPPNGICRVPDTDHNRRFLQPLCAEKGTFELVSDIDLTEVAPTEGEKLYTESEVQEMMQKIKNLQDEKKSGKVKADKTKTSGADKTNKTPKTETAKLEPDTAKA